MYPVVAILAGISIVATAACWLFDNLTEEEINDIFYYPITTLRFK